MYFPSTWEIKPPGRTFHKTLPLFGSILSADTEVFRLMSICLEYLRLSRLAVVVFTYSIPLSSKNNPAMPMDGTRQRTLPVLRSNAVRVAASMIYKASSRSTHGPSPFEMDSSSSELKEWYPPEIC